MIILSIGMSISTSLDEYANIVTSNKNRPSVGTIASTSSFWLEPFLNNHKFLQITYYDSLVIIA